MGLSEKRRFIPNWECSKEENADYPVHFTYVEVPYFQTNSYIYIYIELNSKKHYSRFIFTEEENYSVVITICRKISHTFPCKWEALRISKKHTRLR